MIIIKINGEIGWEVVASDFIRELDNTTGDIEIQISSPGGSVFEGIQIFNAIRAYDRGNVKVVIVSLAASIASYIALAGDEIHAYDNSVYMIHNASVMAWGDHRELRKKADIVSGLSNIIAKAYIAKTKQSASVISELMDAETFLYGEEMLTAGFVDAMISTEDNKDAAAARSLAAESFTACLKSSNERYTNADFEQAAAMLKEQIPEQPTPVKEGNSNSGEGGAENASKLNAINARLTLREKETSL